LRRSAENEGVNRYWRLNLGAKSNIRLRGPTGIICET
jgi:hypothetical protein